EGRPEDPPSPQPGNVSHTRRRGKARARHSVLQATRLIASGRPRCGGVLRRVAIPALLAVRLLWPAPLGAEVVAVRNVEGLLHGFVVVKTTDGATVAHGDLIQRARGVHVTTRLVYHFNDGSTQDETA